MGDWDQGERFLDTRSAPALYKALFMRAETEEAPGLEAFTQTVDDVLSAGNEA